MLGFGDICVGLFQLIIADAFIEINSRFYLHTFDNFSTIFFLVYYLIVDFYRFLIISS